MASLPDLPASAGADLPGSRLPSAGTQPGPAADHSWWWRLEDPGGAVIEVDEEFADQRFPSQADAESWVGEFWAELAVRGVDAVTLIEGERVVYGPMSLRA